MKRYLYILLIAALASACAREELAPETAGPGKTIPEGATVPVVMHFDQPVTLYLPVGANVQITEVPLDYTLLSVVGATNGALSGHTYTLTVAEEDSGKTITFTNQKTQIIDTGVRTSDAPCGAVLALGLRYGIWILRRRRRGAR